MGNFNISTQFAENLIYNISTINSDEIDEEVSAIELDIHAESILVVRHAYIIHHMGKQV